MFKPLSHQLESKLFSPSYSLSLLDTSLQDMYGLTPDLVSRLDSFSSNSLKSKVARELFNFFLENITYGSSKRTQGYASAKQVWRNKEGVCGEMSFLYVAAARYCGLQSSYVSVRKDHGGKNVSHACACVWIPNMILVDIAYRTFNITHQDFSLLSDREVFARYALWKSK